MRHLALITIIGLLSAEFAFAQQRDCGKQTIPVSLYHRDGTPISNLDSADFEGLYGGKSILVNSVTLAQRPHAVLALLDASGSVLEDPREWSFFVNMTKELFGIVPADVEVGFASFSGKIEAAVPPTTDRKRLRDELESVRESALKGAKRRTAIWDAITGGIELFGHPAVGDAIYLITDGNDNLSKADPEKVNRSLITAGVRLFLLLRTPNDSRDIVRPFGPAELQNLAKQTGGLSSLFQWPINEDLINKSGALSQLGMLVHVQHEQILNFNLLNVSVPGPIEKPRPWHLDFHSPDHHEGADTVLAYPQLLPPCR